MLRFVILSNESNSMQYKDIISKSMFNYDIHYETNCFFIIDKKFDEFCEKDFGGLIFLIDNSCFDPKTIINDIRNKYDLYSAFIIIINNKKEGKIQLINNMFLLKAIEKENINSDIKISVENIIKIICNKKKNLTFSYNKILYKMPFNDILYFEKELNSKKCKIICKNKTYHIYKSIIEIERIVDDRFVKTHQSTLVNKDNIKQVEFNTGIIHFDSNISCNLISRNYKKNLKEISTK